MARYPTSVIVVRLILKHLTAAVMCSAWLIPAQDELMLACLLAGTGSAGTSNVHLVGIPFRRDPDFLGYRGILMTLRSLIYSGFLPIRTHLWTPLVPTNRPT